MAPDRRFSALSLDLWFTSIFYAPGQEAGWEAERRRVLADLLVGPGGTSIPPVRIEAGLRAVAERHPPGPDRIGGIDPGALVRELAEWLGAGLTVSAAEAARRYSGAGLAEHPPVINPELPAILRAFRERGVPVALITNTARRGSTWEEFLRGQGLEGLGPIVTSCEIGCAKPDPRIFHAAARRLGVDGSAILHVGDRWELDVVGALAAGCGAALYRGLWDRYPPGLHPDTVPPPPTREEVWALDRLDQLLTADLWWPVATGEPRHRGAAAAPAAK